MNYEIDEQGSIYVSADMNWSSTDYDDFYSEFFAIPHGIKHFMVNIAPII